MADKSKIEWTDATWNPVRGCSRVSEGCRNCYAETVANRFCGPGSPYEGVVQIDADGKGLGKWNGEIKFVEKRLLDPLRWKTPRRIFVNSMSDLFHENVTDEMLDKIFAVMALCPQHTFQVLTKRPERMLVYLSDDEYPLRCADAPADWNLSKEDDLLVSRAMDRRDATKTDSSGSVHLDNPLPNVWLGVSVENQKAADERIPLLLQTPAAVRFLSVEPLLSKVALRQITNIPYMAKLNSLVPINALRLREATPEKGDPYGHPRIDWVIVGGESGPGARPMHPDWARSLRDQCVAAGVPFFFKQWGEWTPGENVDASSGVVQTANWFDGKWSFNRENLANDEGHIDDEPDVYRVGKKAAGDLLDGVQWHEFPRISGQANQSEATK